MNTFDFLSTVLPENGPYYFGSTLTNANGAWKDLPFTNIEDLTRSVIHRSQPGVESYFALSSFDGPGSRTKEHVELIRSSFLDIDVGPGKPFKALQDAKQALVNFLKQTGLLKPTYLVHSGGGLHVYWCMTKGIPRDLWEKNFAAPLVTLTRHYGLEADKLTGNAACVLRPPGTHNHKLEDNPREVHIAYVGNLVRVTDWAKSLRDAIPEGVKVFKLGSSTPSFTPSTPMPASVAALMGAMDEVQRPSSAEKIAEQCQFFKHMRDTQGAEQDEPQWTHALMVLQHTEEGAGICHAWSLGHEDYSPADTDAKLEHLNGYKPATCETIRTLSHQCDDCNLTCKSPISLGIVNPEPQHQVEADEIPEFPPSIAENYRWTGSTLLVKVPKKDSEDFIWVPCTNQFAYISFLSRDRNSDEFLARVMARARPGEWVFSDIGLGSLTSGGPPLLSALGKYVGVIPHGNPRNLEIYMKTWADHMRNTTATTEVRKRLGWDDEGGFLLGTEQYQPDGTIEPVAVARSLADFVPAHAPRGSAERYKEIINALYNRPDYQPYQFVWLSGFGSVLLSMLHEGPVGIPIVSFSEGSGLGKTAASKAAIAIWGNPHAHAQAANAQGGTTDLALTTMAGIRRHLPVLLDETSEWESDKLAGLAYGYASGMAKLQAKAEGGLRNTSDLNWANFLYITSNKSVVNALRQSSPNASAKVARVFEVVFKDHQKPDSAESHLVEELWRNTGHLGRDFLRAIVPRRDKLVVHLREQHQKLRERFAGEGIETIGRYWISAATVILESFKITKALKMHSFEWEPFQEWVYKQVIRMAVQAGAAITDVEEQLSELVSDLMGGFVVLLREGAGREIVPFAPGFQAPRYNITGRAVHQDNRLYLSMAAIKNWCKEHRVDANILADKLKESGALVKDDVRMALGRSTNVPSMRCKCWELRLDAVKDQILPSNVTNITERKGNVPPNVDRALVENSGA